MICGAYFEMVKWFIGGKVGDKDLIVACMKVCSFVITKKFNVIA